MKKPSGKILSAVLSLTLLGASVSAQVAFGAEGDDVSDAPSAAAPAPGAETPSPSQPAPAAPVSLNAAVVSNVDAAYGQTGKPITPNPIVVVDGKKLQKNTDYTVSYKNNVKRGTAKLVITGKGAYTGSITKTFKIQYRIVYKLNGGTNSKKNPSCYAGKSKDKVTAKLAKPTREGYKFVGWYTDKACKNKVTSIQGKGDKTYYAKWKKSVFTITYKNLGKQCVNSKKNPAVYATGDVVKLANPVREGRYKFAGWYSDKKLTKRVKTIDKKTTGNITLYAKWVKGPFTSGDKKVDKEIIAISKRHKSLKSAFNWVKNHPHHNFSSRTYPVGSTHWGAKEARNFLFSDKKDCYGFAATFYYLALEKGYDAKLVSGKVPLRRGGYGAHGWVEIKIKGKTYVYDPDLQRQYPGYKFYQFTYSTAPLTYRLR